MRVTCPHCEGQLFVYRERAADFAEKVIVATGEHFGLDPDDIVGPRKYPALSRARQVAYWVLRQRGYTFPFIGSKFSRDHSTVQYGVRKVKASQELADAGRCVMFTLGQEGA